MAGEIMWPPCREHRSSSAAQRSPITFERRHFGLSVLAPGNEPVLDVVQVHNLRVGPYATTLRPCFLPGIWVRHGVVEIWPLVGALVAGVIAQPKAPLLVFEPILPILRLGAW